MTHPRPPAHVQPYVEALGAELALTFLLHFGGADLYIPANPTGRSELVKVIGEDGALALYRIRDKLQYRVPTAKPWIAQMLKEKGLSKADIARKMHVIVPTVTKWLNGGTPRPFPDPDQLSLF